MVSGFPKIQNPRWNPFTGIRKSIWVPVPRTEPNLSSRFSWTECRSDFGFPRMEPETHSLILRGVGVPRFLRVLFFSNRMRVKIVLFYFKAQWGVDEHSCCLFGGSCYGFGFNETRNGRWIPFTGIRNPICVPLPRTELNVSSRFPRTESSWGSGFPGTEPVTDTPKTYRC